MSDAERIDISEELGALCVKLGYEKANVRRLVVEPTSVTVETFVRTEQGGFRMLADDVLVNEDTFKVMT